MEAVPWKPLSKPWRQSRKPLHNTEGLSLALALLLLRGTQVNLVNVHRGRKVQRETHRAGHVLGLHMLLRTVRPTRLCLHLDLHIRVDPARMQRDDAHAPPFLLPEALGESF